MLYKREKPDQTVLPKHRESAQNENDSKGSSNSGSSKESGRSPDGNENSPDEDRTPLDSAAEDTTEEV